MHSVCAVGQTSARGRWPVLVAAWPTWRPRQPAPAVGAGTGQQGKSGLSLLLLGQLS